MAVAGGAFAVLILFGRFLPRWPGALVVVVLGIVASWLLDLEAHGVSVTGSIPAGLPSFARPHVTGSELLSLALPAVAIFLVSFSDAILTARSFAARHGETIDADQELLSFSAANVAAGFTHGMPIGTSGSRTAVNDSMKATSQVSGLVSFGTIVLILLFLTAPIRYLPTAVLGAVIVYASLKLIDPAQWRELASSSRTEVAIAAITSVVVVGIGVLPAIVVAVVLSIIDVVRRTATPERRRAGLLRSRSSGTPTSAPTPTRASPPGWSSTGSRSGSSSPTPTSSSAGCGRPWTAHPSPSAT